MRSFRNILFVSRGVQDDTDALKQALSLVLIGNAAENIVQKIRCSLPALKPRGVVSR